MQLVNRTPLTAAANFSRDPHDEQLRVLMITAKATFSFDARGHVQLDTQQPYPLFPTQMQTELGLLPRDDLPGLRGELEVILLGNAHAPAGKPIAQRSVSLRVGSVLHELEVFGDRTWLTHEEISAPELFSALPLTYARAYGGSFDVLIDADSKLRISDQTNSEGLGFDLEHAMRGFGEALRAPEGYPKLPGYIRQLPNVEHPERLISQWSDAPLPAGWATLAFDSGIRSRWVFDRIAAERPISQDEVIAHAYQQAHPDWVIPLPPKLPIVEMKGVVPFETATFLLPDLQPVADVLHGTTVNAHALAPRMLVLLPEELRFYMVYQCVLKLPYVAGKERGVRLRIEHGWTPGNDAEAVEHQA